MKVGWTLNRSNCRYCKGATVGSAPLVYMLKEPIFGGKYSKLVFTDSVSLLFSRSRVCLYSFLSMTNNFRAFILSTLKLFKDRMKAFLFLLIPLVSCYNFFHEVWEFCNMSCSVHV